MAAKPVIECLLQRHSVRRYSSRPLDSELVFAILEATNRTPSGFNLQPWHFVLVEDGEIKRLLQHIALGQRHVGEAPLVLVFACDTRCWREPFDRLLLLANKSGRLPKDQVVKQRRQVQAHFELGLWGLRGTLKRFTHLFRRLGGPTAAPICSQDELEAYMRSQTMLAVSSFLVAAESLGLATCPVEGFDEDRLKRLLNIPSRMRVPAIITLGYPVEGDVGVQSQRFPLEEKLHFDLFSKKRLVPGEN